MSWSEIGFVEIRGLVYATRIARPASIPASKSEWPVILLHGFSGSSEEWADTAAALSGAGHVAIAIDLPGHGATAVPADPSRFTMPETVRDLGHVLAGFGYARAHWHGYSMGGRIALYLAITEPAQVSSLILESTSPGIAAETERAERRTEDEALASEIESRGIAWFVEQWERRPIFASQRRAPEGAVADQRARRLRNRAAGLAGSLRGVGQGAQAFLGTRLGGIRCPTRVLAGELDSTYVAIGRSMASAIPEADLTIVPGAGHNIHLEQPGAFRRALLEHVHRFRRSPDPSASVPR
jgi:2-succinyl-6-hydroxy-2,4-cyclohexadiene-1-carboxylate synthase